MFKKALINLKKDIKELKSLGFSKIDIISYYTAAIMIHRISRSMVLALTLFLYYYIGRPIELSRKTQSIFEFFLVFF